MMRTRTIEFAGVLMIDESYTFIEPIRTLLFENMFGAESSRSAGAGRGTSGRGSTSHVPSSLMIGKRVPRAESYR